MAWLDTFNTFTTGRTDCTPDESLERPFFTSNKEIHPHPQGNGVMTTDFFNEHLKLTARESIALLEGAHSYGTMNPRISFMKYPWTRNQQLLLNNQMFKHLVLVDQYIPGCDGKDQADFLGCIKKYHQSQSIMNT